MVECGAMRQPRIKVEGEGFYHVVSRIGGRRFLIDDAEKGILLSMIRAAAIFSGVELYTYAVMSNHFHLLVRVPRKQEVSDKELLRRMEALKTGCLICAAVEMGLTAAQADKELMEAGRQYGENLGLAFQLIDDILDVRGSREAMGKTPGKDAQEGKTTAVSILGLEGALQAAQRATEEAVSSLGPFGGRGVFLQEIARHMLSRVS